MTDVVQPDLFDTSAQAQLAPAARVWPAAWEQARSSKIADLMRREKWTPVETAFYLTCSDEHIYNLIDDGQISGFNNSLLPESRPNYRIYRDSVIEYEKRRRVGAPEEKK